MNMVVNFFWLIVSLAVTKLFYVWAKGTRLMDKPNERSLHTNPTLRGGGLVFIGLSLLALPVIAYYTHTSFNQLFIPFISITLLALISFMDDLYQLSARLRFLVQCLVALLIVLFMRPEKLDFILYTVNNVYWISIFLFLSTIWAINHFNFMDGLDGFCAAQAIFLLVAYAFLFIAPDALVYKDFCWVLVFSLLGFLKFNFPPARLFMGDVGSASLGLITFLMAVIAQQKFDIPILYWFLLNALFLFDATLTLLRRILNKEQWFAPHRKHAYQRIKQLGIDTKTILLGQFLLNALFFILVLLFEYNKINLVLVLFIQMLCMVVLYFIVEKNFPMFQRVAS